MSTMKVTVEKIISLSEEDGIDELQKHLTLASDDKVCICGVYCTHSFIHTVHIIQIRYKCSVGS